jgi:hypothetical protein
MPDWLPPLPPPPSPLPGGWWTVAAVAAAIGVLIAFIILRGLRKALPSGGGDGVGRGRLVGKPSDVRDPSPPGLPPGEEERLRRVRAVADFLDNSLKIPGVGFPIGWDSVIGLMPGVGDAVTGTLAGWIVVQGHQLGVPKRTLLRMCGNAGVDLAGGAVPGVGDAFDVLFKANRKNLRLIELHLAKPPKDRKRLPG